MRTVPTTLTLLSLAFLNSFARGEISVRTDFEGASAKVVSIGHAPRTVRITPGGDPARGWPCWWYLRIDGLAKGDTLTLEVVPLDAPLVGPGKNRGKPLAAGWCQPARAAVSHDGKKWQQTEPGRAREGVMSYKVQAHGESLWLAWGPPFTPKDSAELVESLAKKCRGSEAFELCQSNGGRPCPALRLVSERPSERRPGVWIQARQHAWESGSSWVCRGAAEWLASDDRRAAALREKAEITIVPIMDIDSTATGNGGKECLPQDHNRDWTDRPHHAEVAAAQKHLRQWADEKRLALFVDLHNPGPGDMQPFFYCCPDSSLTEAGRTNLDRFLTLCRGEMNGPLALADKPRTSGPAYDPLWRQMSKNWVAAHAPPHAVAVTLESAWNTPDSTTDGYRRLGEQLGQAIAKFLREDVRK
ncbi:MAG: M14-type cytosolic carboxypeptidase [Planctomycetaceae bacterium]|nr:M14-type cytosolic carboxypeptidase [Planctomycetaceae bacterium]